MNDADYREVVWFVNAASVVVLLWGPPIASPFTIKKYILY